MIQPMFAVLLVLLLLVSTGCMHRIQVNPLPVQAASTSIPRSLGVVVGPPALEGADHRPGITLLEWPHQSLREAVIQYARHRRTFSSVVADSAELGMNMTTKLTLSSRQGRYHYHIRLQAELSEAGRPIKTYRAEGAAAGSTARWVTASDRDPVESALTLALDDLFARIEEDRSLYGKEAGSPVP